MLKRLLQPLHWKDYSIMMVTPPKSLEELRRLYIQIRNRKHKIRLTDRTLTILKGMLDDPNGTAAKSISEIATENNINISSITRLAQKLGFIGFPELKDLFRSNLKQHKGYYTDKVNNFLQKGSTGHYGKNTLLEQVIQKEWSNVMLMAEAFDKDKFTAIIRLIINTKKILIVGLRGSYPIAHYLGSHLKMIREQVILIGQVGHTLAEDLSVLNPGDLLIAISVNPYTKDTITACRVAKKQDGNIIAITDSLSSPLALETDYFLITPILGDSFFSPIASAIICIEILLSELVKQLGNRAIQRLNHMEYIFEEMGIETEI